MSRLLEEKADIRYQVGNNSGLQGFRSKALRQYSSGGSSGSGSGG